MDGSKLRRHLGYMKRDFRGEFCFLSTKIFLKLYACLICWPWNMLKCLCLGIQTGLDNRFYGNVIFYRFPLSCIKIGKRSVFNSSDHLNLIGVNHSCILSTHATNAQISIGNGCGFSGTTVAAAMSVKIGNHVLCGANTVINDFDWHMDRFPSEPKLIIIEDNVWLGVNVVVMKGVTIGKNTIIGANSIVTKSIPANVIAAGNPCRVIKSRETANEK